MIHILQMKQSRHNGVKEKLISHIKWQRKAVAIALERNTVHFLFPFVSLPGRLQPCLSVCPVLRNNDICSPKIEPLSSSLRPLSLAPLCQCLSPQVLCLYLLNSSLICPFLFILCHCHCLHLEPCHFFPPKISCCQSCTLSIAARGIFLKFRWSSHSPG